MIALAATIIAIVAGTPDPDDTAVVGIAHRVLACGDAAAPPLECTGTLIGPRTVLTAAHCLAGGPANALAVSFAPIFPGDAALVPVVAGAAHPAYDDATHANDLAVLVLAADAPASATPIPLHAAALDAALVGTEVTLVGYGITTATGTDVGTRARGTAKLSAVDADTISMTPDPAMSCHGDSGGPVLLAGELVGVTSYGDPACAALGVAMRVDRQLAFIASIAAPAAQPAFDPSAPLCDLACTTDADCPVETQCFGQQCGYRGLPAGELGRACTSDAACPCVVTPGDGACREFHPCSAEAGATCRPLAADDPGCGCRSTSNSAGWLVLLLYGVANRRSKAASPRPVAARTSAR